MPSYGSSTGSRSFLTPLLPPPLSIGYVDDIIAPRDTRKRLIGDLEMLKNKKLENPARKHGNIPL